MKLWPWKLTRRSDLDELRAAAAAAVIDNQEATKQRDDLREERNQLLKQRAELQIEVQDLSKNLRDAQAEYERLQEEADTSANTADGLRSQLRIRDEEMARLKDELAHARHGESEVYVLQSKGAPINAARSWQGAVQAAEMFGVPADSWGPSAGTRTDGWTITEIQLVADAPPAIPSQAGRN
ncbi:hypothetical protein AB0G35_24140 [Streptomyces sp. NPDC021749]|uniref:hypothetical protein n=1 Tax=Streptomyces sp. NPDC021749 TaxID=3154905 RepID=UPI0033D707EB